jgi:hypothetical protein
MKGPTRWICFFLWLDLTTIGVAQARYADGQFPPGKVYQEADLKGLVGQTLSEPSYLVGKFMYLGVVRGKQLFSTFSEVSGDLIKGGNSGAKSVVFGKTLIAVTFFDNFPSELTSGKAIAPNETVPLVLKRVMESENGYLFVETECLSAN